MATRKRENIFLASAGAVALGLCFIPGSERGLTSLYRSLLAAALVALVMSLVLAHTIALLRKWRRLSKNLVALFLVLLHPFTNRIWLDNQYITVVWIMLAGYLCIDLHRTKLFPISLALPIIATPFAFFESLTMVSFWILVTNGILHIFLNDKLMNRYCSFFIALASFCAAVSSFPIFGGARYSMVVAYFVLVLAFFEPEFKQMYRIRKENEEIVAHERALARIEEQSLKEEIRPHFLLNALNNVHVAYHESPENGRELLDALIRLENFAIEASRAQAIPLHQEVTILQGLIELFESERKHKIAFEVELADPYLMIPPLLLEPLVENSLQHSGVLHQDDGKISVAQWLDHGFATILIRDNGVERPLPSPSRGIGLSNVQRRISLLDEGKMNITSDESGTTIEITFRPEESLTENGTV